MRLEKYRRILYVGMKQNPDEFGINFVSKFIMVMTPLLLCEVEYGKLNIFLFIFYDFVIFVNIALNLVLMAPEHLSMQTGIFTVIFI